MPKLVQGRFLHSSIAINGHLFVLGGYKSATEITGSIESFDTKKNDAWKKVVDNNTHVERAFACVVAINSNKLAIFGGYDNRKNFLNDRYIFNLSSKTIQPILGDDRDFTLCNITQA